jgi:cytochrome c oxidase subunit 3
MSEILSDRVKNAREVVMVPASIDHTLPRGTYYWGFFALACAIFAFFAGLVVAFLFRAQSQHYWAPLELPKSLWLSTALIAISSITCELARKAGRRAKVAEYQRYLAITVVIGLGFVVSQFASWWKLVQQGVYLAENPHASFFYIFTGLHAAHLFFGIGALLVLLTRVMRRHTAPKRREWVDVVAFYWHFLGVLWLCLFAILLWVG